MATGIILDGQLSWGAGVHSLKPTTVKSDIAPDGVPRNGLCWLNNGSVRDGGISPRGAYNYRGTFHGPNGLFQGKFLYDPITDANPYWLTSISGRIWQVFPDAPEASIDLSAVFGLTNPPDLPYSYFVQGEQFLVIQAGDLITLPLFWDGAILRRSNGINPAPTATHSVTLTSTFLFVANSITATIPTAAPYPGALGDIVRWESPNGAVVIGIFKVTATAANSITLELYPQRYFTGGGVGAGTGNFVVLGNPTPAVPELPAATAMHYYMGRIWYGQGRLVVAGDIVRGGSGTAAYNFDDSILKVTENPLAIGGDGFKMPTQAGNVRAISDLGTQDTTLGQGVLIIGTRKAAYALKVPVTRADWIAAGSANQPLLVPIQKATGIVNDRSVVPVKGDLYFQTLEPGIGSILNAVRYFNQPGNRTISANENRVLQFTNRALLKFATGITFNNLLLQSNLPEQTAQGVIHKAIIPLDFLPISSFNEDSTPIWNGVQEGLDIFQLSTGDFGGLERAFAFVRSSLDGSFQVYELTTVGRTDTNTFGESRINWAFETPALPFGQEMLQKELVSGELWIDRLSSEVVFQVDYRPDSATCWVPWIRFKVCSAKNTAEDCDNPITYPITPYGDGFKIPLSFPKPPVACIALSGRPSNIGFQFQTRVIIRGYCRIRGLLLYATIRDTKLYEGMVCLENPS
jgi:hypothetical protein